MNIYDFADKLGAATRKFQAEIGQELMDVVGETITKHKTEENELLISSIFQEVMAVIDERMGVSSHLIKEAEDGNKAN